jgi:FxsC-like protein
VPGSLESGPYFFLSYAHTPRHDQSDSLDPDFWVGELHKELCRHIMHLTGLPQGAKAGFMDRELQSGHDWPQGLARALATCRVFVPLYSRRYFASQQCGKEWFAFTRRLLNHAARVTDPVQAIIPAVWVPVKPDLLPEAARSIQVDYGNVESYAAEGFYGIVKLSRFRDDYQEAAYHLAKRIVEVAESTPVRAGPVADYESLESAFGADGQGMPGDQRLRITIVAPRSDELPPGRGDFHYGQSARDWNPYRPESVRGLADHAAGLARSLGYRADIGDLEQHAGELLKDGPPGLPEVLIIDPWAVMLPQCQRLLQKLDAMDKPWVQVVIPWSSADLEIARAEPELRGLLDSCLLRKLAEGRATSALAVRGVPAIEDFSMVLPIVVETAARHYLRYTQAPADGQAGT